YVPIISLVIGHALRDAVETRLHAELSYDSLTYSFPYRVYLKNVVFKTDPSLSKENLLTIGRLDLQLSQLPWLHHPVVIRSLELQSPSLHMVKKPEGIVGSTGLAKSDEEQQANPPEHHLSDMFELRKFSINGGEIRFENRTIEGTEPFVFRDITADL